MLVLWSYKRSYKPVGERVRSYETVYTTVLEVHSTSVHIRLYKQAPYDQHGLRTYWSYMVKYGQTRSSTGIHGLNVYQSFHDF